MLTSRRYEVFIDRAAQKVLRKLPARERGRIEDRIESLADDPRPPGSRKLAVATSGAYRVRQGDYRVIYNVDDAALEVTVTRVAHRNDVYR